MKMKREFIALLLNHHRWLSEILAFNSLWPRSEIPIKKSISIRFTSNCRSDETATNKTRLMALLSQSRVAASRGAQKSQNSFAATIGSMQIAYNQLASDSRWGDFCSPNNRCPVVNWFAFRASTCSQNLWFVLTACEPETVLFIAPGWMIDFRRLNRCPI